MTDDLVSRIGCKSFNLPAYRALILLASRDTLNLSQMSKIINYSEKYTGEMIKNLENSGLLKRVFAGRSVHVKLTDSGKTLYNELSEEVAQCPLK